MVGLQRIRRKRQPPGVHSFLEKACNCFRAAIADRVCERHRARCNAQPKKPMKRFILSLSAVAALIAPNLATQGGQFSNFGSGCAGANGIPHVHYSGSPRIGALATVQVSRAQAYSPGVLFFGSSNTWFGGIPLPLSLGAGCSLLVSAELGIGFYTTNTGTHGQALRIPSDPRLIGESVFNQATIVDAAAATGLAWSNGGRILIGIPPIHAPSNLRPLEIRKASVTIGWNDNSNNETHFRVEKSTQGGPFEVAGTVAANRTHYQESNLTPCQLYRFRVIAVGVYSESAPSPELSVTPTPLTPNPPTNLRASDIKPRSLMLRWNDNNDVELGFEVFHSSNGRDFNLHASTGRDRNYLRVGPIAPNCAHWFKVRVLRSCGVRSAFSNTIFVNTPDVPPAAPCHLRAAEVRRRQVDLVWSDNADNELVYRVAISRNGVDWNNRAVLGANATAYTVTELERQTTYHFKVRCRNDAGFSDYSNVITITTK